MNKGPNKKNLDGVNNAPKNSNDRTSFAVERVISVTRKKWLEGRRDAMEENKMTGENIIQQLIDNARDLTGNTVPGFQYSEESNEAIGNPRYTGIKALGDAIENYFGGRTPRSNKDKVAINNFLRRTPFEGILDMDYGPAIRLVGSKIPVEKFYDSMKGVQASYAFLAILVGIHRTAVAKEFVQGDNNMNIARLDGIIKSISRQDEVSIGSVISTAAHHAQYSQTKE